MILLHPHHFCNHLQHAMFTSDILNTIKDDSVAVGFHPLKPPPVLHERFLQAMLRKCVVIPLVKALWVGRFGCYLSLLLRDMEMIGNGMIWDQESAISCSHIRHIRGIGPRICGVFVPIFPRLHTMDHGLWSVLLCPNKLLRAWTSAVSSAFFLQYPKHTDRHWPLGLWMAIQFERCPTFLVKQKVHRASRCTFKRYHRYKLYRNTEGYALPLIIPCLTSNVWLSEVNCNCLFFRVAAIPLRCTTSVHCCTTQPVRRAPTAMTVSRVSACGPWWMAARASARRKRSPVPRRTQSQRSPLGNLWNSMGFIEILWES